MATSRSFHLKLHGTEASTFYLCGKINNEGYNNKPCSEADLSKSIQDAVSSVSPEEPQHALNNICF